MLVRMSANDFDLLRAFTRDQSQDAFATLVQRHLNLVYCAAWRQVRSPQLAEEVAQSVFADLARQAAGLKPETVLTAWLYQITRRTAIDVVRREARRQLREQIASEMNAMNATADDWTQIEPLLDEAMHALDDTDRTAVLLRYFENKSLREVGEALGTTDDAARKRVNRAVDRLREFFDSNGVSVSTSGLALVISANAVQAAPVGLAVTISAATVLLGETLVPIVATTQAIAMTTLQKALVATTLVAAIGVGIHQFRENAKLREQNAQLERQHASLSEQLQQAQSERDTARSRVATAPPSAPAQEKANSSELLKLRGQVGVLRQEKTDLGSKSPLSKVTADPETRTVMRSQQKAAMSALYSGLAKSQNWTPEVKGQFDDLLADGIMDGIDLITRSLHEKRSRGEVDQLFSAHEQAFQEKVSTLLGAEGTAQYQEFTRDLGSTITAAQFEAKLSGETAAKAEKKQQLLQAMQEETRATLASAGLPADFQTLPMLNFRNIASEEQAEIGLKIMDGTFERAATRAASFLSPEELQKFQEFRAKAVENNRSMILMNRKMMAPIAQ